MLIAPGANAQDAATPTPPPPATPQSYKPSRDNFQSEWILGWIKPANSTDCTLSGGKSTVMMVCNEAQFLADHPLNVAPSKFNTTVMGNTGIVKVFEYGYRTDQRLMMQKNSTGTPTGNLLSYDGADKNWNYLFLFSTYYNIDWLAINTNDRWIGYLSNDFKVQWWFNYLGASKVTRIFNNLYQTP